MKTPIFRHVELTPCLLRAYLEEYGLNFFSKLDKYKTCSVELVDGKTYFQIKKVSGLRLTLFNQVHGQIELDWFYCDDFVL